MPCSSPSLQHSSSHDDTTSVSSPDSDSESDKENKEDVINKNRELIKEGVWVDARIRNEQRKKGTSLYSVYIRRVCEMQSSEVMTVKFCKEPLKSDCLSSTCVFHFPVVDDVSDIDITDIYYLSPPENVVDGRSYGFTFDTSSLTLCLKFLQ